MIEEVVEAPVRVLRILRQIFAPLHRTGRHPFGGQPVHHCVRRLRAGPLSQLAVDLIVVVKPTRCGCQLGAAGPVGMPQDCYQRRPLLVRVHRDSDPLILSGAGIDPLGRGVPLPVAQPG